MSTALHFTTGEELERIAPKVKSTPRLELAPEATTHVQRASWARESQRTRSQGQRLTADERRHAVALAVASRIAPARWTAAELATHVGAEVEEVESVLSEWEDQGLIVRPAPGQIDTLTPAVVRALAGRSAAV